MGRRKRTRAQAALAGTRADAVASSQDAARIREERGAARKKRMLAEEKLRARPPLARRIGAFAIDWYVGSVIASVPVMAVHYVVHPDAPAVMDLATLPFCWALAAGTASVALSLLYYVVVPWRTNGQTLGKKICGVRICPQGSNEPLSLRMTLMRQLVGILVIEGSLYTATALLWQLVFWNVPYVRRVVIVVQYVITGASALLVLLTGRRRALHDLIARTEVRRV